MQPQQLTVFLALVLATRALAVPADAEPLRGIVLTAQGKPAAGAIVWAARHTYGPLERRETVADANGRYALRLYPGEWYIWARHGTQGAEAPARSEAVEIPAGRAPEELNITLEERGMLRGRLLEAETGKPIAGGRLFLDTALVLTTNKDGRFETGGLARTNHESFVVAAGRQRIRVLFDTTARAETELDVPVPRGGTIVGRVTDAEGKPIAGAYVGRGTSGTHFSINALYEPCDADGRFVYHGVSLDRPTSLAGYAPGFVDELRDDILLGPGEKPAELIFRLRPQPPETPAGKDDKRRVVSGVVLGPNSVPQPGVAIRWGTWPHAGAPRTKTDDGGRFRLTVPDDTNTLVVVHRVYQVALEQVAAGGDKEVVIRLRAGKTARGRVIDEAGHPVRDVHIAANGTWDKRGRTGPDGKFEILGVSEGAVFDFVKHGMTDLRGQSLNLDAENNTVVVQYGGAIKGRVVDRDGRPIRSFRVLLDFPRNRQPTDRTDIGFAGHVGIGVRFTSADGSFVFTNIGDNGVYRVRVLAEGHSEAVEDRVASAPVNRLAKTEAVTLKAGASVHFRVRAVDASGKPIAGARVALIDGRAELDRSINWSTDEAGWENVVRGQTGPDGWADFPALAIGAATVVVRAPGYARQHVGWRAAEKEMTLTMPAEAVATGVVRDPTGGSLKEGHVVLRSGTDLVAVKINDAGHFRAAELPAGNWTLQVYGPDGQTVLHERELSVKPGESKELTIDTK
jgi:protocatechuate 3,4-dioxygenase beta subunit